MLLYKKLLLMTFGTTLVKLPGRFTPGRRDALHIADEGWVDTEPVWTYRRRQNSLALTEN